MKRQTFLKIPAALLATGALPTLASLAAVTAMAARPAHAQPAYTVSLQQMQAAAATRFPRRYPMGGLLELTLQAPTLRLLPDANRVGSVMAVDAAGPLLGRPATGSIDVDFGLRYERSDRTLRATQPRLHALTVQGLPPDAAMLLNVYGPQLAQQSLQEVVLHQLEAKDLALADTMGLEPGEITVTADGLRVGFVTKPAG